MKDIADSELILNRIKDEVSDLKYQRDISEAELTFFYNEVELISTVERLNLSLSEFERTLQRSINQLLQVFNGAADKIKNGALVIEVAEDVKNKRSAIFANWDENKLNHLSLIRTFTSELKEMLLKRLKEMTL